MSDLFEDKEGKRRARRIDLRAQMSYQVRGNPSFSNSTLSNNISTGGVGFNADRFLATLTPLMLEIDILSRVLHPIGRVAWCQPLPYSDRNRLGVEFIEIDPLEKNYLQDYIDMQSGKL